MKSMFDNLAAIAGDTQNEDIKMIDIEELHASDDNFFIVEKIEEFAATILGQGGVKDNLIVRPLESGGYEIISGHRRRAAVQYLIDKGENISHYLPCLVQEYANEDEKMLDLILMNVTARQISDSELWKAFEVLDRILKEKKDQGEYYGRVRDDLAKSLGVSSAQVGKMQNVDKNAIKPVKDAVASGDLSISTANEIAKLPEEEQKKLAKKNLTEVAPKDIKKKEKKNDKSVDTSINEGKSKQTAAKKKKTELMNWAASLNKDQIDFLMDDKRYNQAIYGYLIAAAKEAGFAEDQIHELLSGLKAALETTDKEKAEDLYVKFF